jgi:CheY-like chemotaxis protein
VVLYTDPALLEQILRNYLSNALRYTKEGSVTLAATRGDDAVRIDVVDTGEGIPVDKQSAIFREFYQLHNPERDRSKGLGLGLAIVKRLSVLLKHTVGVQAEPGHGSTFWVEVPLGAGQPAAPLAPDAMEQMSSGAPAMLVVIDDDRSVRESTRHLFEEWGCEVVAGASTASVLTMLERLGRRPEGIVADYRLREGHTGLEAIRILHEQYGDDIPCLIITGDTASEPLRSLRNSGVQLLHKPVAPAKLRAFLNNVRRAAAKRD